MQQPLRSFSVAEFSQCYPWLAESLVYQAEMESTSLCAREIVESGGSHSGLIVVADHQVSGRGRRGNVWQAQSASSLLFTLVLEPELDPSCWSKLGLSVGLAVVNVLRELGYSAALKWPNDVWVSGKKCCGVLVETVGDHVLLGVGLNVYSAPEVGSCLAAEGPDLSCSREELLGLVVQEIIRLVSISNLPHLIEQCNRVHSLTRETVSLFEAGASIEGEVIEITQAGGLRLVTANGERIVMQAHDVRILHV